MAFLEEKLNVNQIIRYGYTGGLLFLFLAILKPEKVGDVIKSLGGVVSPIVVITIGALFYISFRAVVGDLIDLIHIWVHRSRCKRCTLRYLAEEFKIGIFGVFILYRIIRDKLHEKDKDILKSLTFQRSEIHLLYLSSVICVIALIFAHKFLILIPAVLFFGGGLYLDIRICSIEYSYINNIVEEKKEEIKKFLSGG